MNNKIFKFPVLFKKFKIFQDEHSTRDAFKSFFLIGCDKVVPSNDKTSLPQVVIVGTLVCQELFYLHVELLMFITFKVTYINIENLNFVIDSWISIILIIFILCHIFCLDYLLCKTPCFLHAKF